MIKLICTDVDGTLVDSEGNLLDCDRQALKKAYEMGIQTAIVSGRYRPGIEKIADMLGFPVWYTCFNGIYIEADNRKVLYKGNTDKNSLKEALQISLDYGCYPVLFSEDEWFVQSKGYYYDMQCKRLSAKGSNICNLQNILDSDTTIYKLIVKNKEPNELEKVRETIVKRRIPNVSLVYSSPYILEVLPKDTDKAKAVEAYSKYMGIDTSQIMALGDYDNDINMIKAAGCGVAMGNGTEECKACADFVTKKVTEGGLSYALNKLIFEKDEPQNLQFHL